MHKGGEHVFFPRMPPSASSPFSEHSWHNHTSEIAMVRLWGVILLIMHQVCLFVPYTNQRHCEVCCKTCHVRWGAPGLCSEGTGVRLPALWQKNVHNIFRLGDRDAIVFTAMWSPVAGKNVLKCSKTAEGSPGHGKDGCENTWMAWLNALHEQPFSCLLQGMHKQTNCIIVRSPVWGFALP